MNSNRIFNRFLPGLLIIFIGAVYVFLSFNIEFLGDDLGFYNSYKSQADAWYALPRFMYRHWIWNNGRMADMLTPIGLNILPLWVNAIINGAVTALMFWIIIKSMELDKKLTPFIQILAITCITFTFRWDALWMEFITQYNYVFTATFGLGVLWLLLHGDPGYSGWYRIVSLPFCFVAAAMHEAMGVPMAAGLVIMFLSGRTWKSLSTVRKLMTIMIIAGGIFPLTSPPAWNRVGAMMQPETVGSMLIFSGGWLCILLIALIVKGVRNPSNLLKLFQSPWILYFSASVLSCAFMLMSRFGGRTGWFCQIFALIALGQMFDWKSHFRSRWWNALACILAGLILFHYLEVAIWQKRLYQESKKIISLYSHSDSGIIFYDYHSEKDLPWFLFRKVHAFPDDDDTYYRFRIRTHHSDSERQLMVLPTEVSGKIENINGPVSFRNRYSTRLDSNPDYILTKKPIPDEYGDTIVEIFPRIFTLIDGREYIRNSFNYNSETLYLYSLVDRDRGEK